LISGVPTAVSSGTYAVTATNSAGSSTASASINITANTPVLSYSVTNEKVGDSVSISPTINSRGSAATCSTTTTLALPAGLSINSSCLISGVPTAVSSGSYTVTASNSAGSSTASASINITANTPVLSYSVTNEKVGNSVSITPTINNRGASVTCSTTTTPALPAGLSINSSCVISGVPTAVSSGTYTVTASNSAGSRFTNAPITVNVGLPVISISPGSVSSTVGGVFSVNPTVTSNGATTSCSITAGGSLPDGLTLNSSTCAINGTPTSVKAVTNYTITASNSAGSRSANISITIGPGNFSCKDFGYDGPDITVSSFSNCIYNCSTKNLCGGVRYGDKNCSPGIFKDVPICRMEEQCPDTKVGTQSVPYESCTWYTINAYWGLNFNVSGCNSTHSCAMVLQNNMMKDYGLTYRYGIEFYGCRGSTTLSCTHAKPWNKTCQTLYREEDIIKKVCRQVETTDCTTNQVLNCN
jgi:hypothetical protein